MKIQCECGALIPDSSDYLSYKAYLIADQDYEDMIRAVEERVRNLAAVEEGAGADAGIGEDSLKAELKGICDSITRHTRRALYQCTSCGRLLVEDSGGTVHPFSPDREEAPKNLLWSVEGERWKRPLRGNWMPWVKDQLKGTLWWGGADAESGFEQFSDWESLKRRYFEVFRRLKGQDILRNAFLSDGKEMIHRWP